MPLIIFFTFSTYCLKAQSNDRIDVLNENLRTLSSSSPGLNEKVRLSVSGVSIQEFLRALAEASGLNIYVDQELSRTIVNNFQSETPLNILLFLAKEYDLDYVITGSIISVKPYDVALAPKKAKIVDVKLESEQEEISMGLENDTLGVVARKITNLTGKNVIVTNSIKDTLVSLSVEHMKLKDALLQLAFNNHIKVMETSDGSFVLMPLSTGEENILTPGSSPTVRQVSRAAAADGSVPGNLQLVVDPAVDQKSGNITVDASNMPIIQIIKNAAEQTGENYFIYEDIQGNVTTHLTKVNFSNLLSALLRGTDYTYQVNNGIYTIGNRNLEGLRDIKVIQLQYRSLDTIQAMIPAEWKKGIEIKEFREQNTLLVAGASPQVNEICKLITELDKLVPMVLIEVNMLDIRKGHEVSTGITAGISDSVKTGGTIFPGVDYTFGSRSINDFLSRISTGGAFNLGRVTPNFYVRLNALEKNNNVEMRSVPKLSTLNGHSASLSIGNSRYFSVSTQNVLGSLNPQTLVTEAYTKVDADMTIKIKPIVSGDDQVTLDIKIDITDFTQDTPINEPPPSTNSKFESIIRVRNEETVVLGGIERYESTESGSGVPLLSRIPILKWLFSSRSKSKNKIVSVVFIKPTIIYQ